MWGHEGQRRIVAGVEDWTFVRGSSHASAPDGVDVHPRASHLGMARRDQSVLASPDQRRFPLIHEQTRARAAASEPPCPLPRGCARPGVPNSAAGRHRVGLSPLRHAGAGSALHGGTLGHVLARPSFRRDARTVEPSASKPMIIKAQVAGSGIADATGPNAKSTATTEPVP